jgi:conjugative transfer signal peptidase TraF
MTSRRMLAGASSLLLAAVVTWFAGLRVNLSASMPIGFYRVSRGRPVKGAMVLACLPVDVAIFARSRAYVPNGTCPGATAPIGKVVLAMVGDSVEVTSEGLLVNGRPVRNTKPLAVDGAGRSLPRFPDGTYVVGQDEVWLYSSYSKRSFDSRYFGPLRLSCILNRVLPLWTVE